MREESEPPRQAMMVAFLGLGGMGEGMGPSARTSPVLGTEAWLLWLTERVTVSSINDVVAATAKSPASFFMGNASVRGIMGKRSQLQGFFAENVLSSEQTGEARRAGTC
jgi:hypothetical protein